MRRFVDQSTTWQKLILAVGALAGALAAVVALIGSLDSLVDGNHRSSDAVTARSSTSTGGISREFRRTEPLTSESADVDELVALLRTAADAYLANPDAAEARVTLAFRIEAEPDNNGRVTLGYRCPSRPPCDVILQAWGDRMFDVNHGATFFDGVYVVQVQRGQPDRDIEFGLCELPT